MKTTLPVQGRLRLAGSACSTCRYMYGTGTGTGFQSILLWYNHFSFGILLRFPIHCRLCLREYCIEVLRSAYNTLVRQVRRVLERNAGSSSHDDSYLLWAIRFFMEFNRLSGLQLQLVRWVCVHVFVRVCVTCICQCQMPANILPQLRWYAVCLTKAFKLIANDFDNAHKTKTEKKGERE